MAHMTEAPRDYYGARRAHFGEGHARAKQQADRIADMRLLVFAIAIATAAAAWWHYLSGWWLLLPAAAFAVLVACHERAHRRMAHAALGEDLYSGWLSALEGKARPCAFEQSVSAPLGHLYATDLDIFGRGGLFELLCRTRTGIGASTLAGWLLAPAPPETVQARQQAVLELAQCHALREALALEAGAVQSQVSAGDLQRWAREPARLALPPRMAVAAVLTLIAIASILAAFFVGTFLPVLALAINIIFITACREGTRALDTSLEPISRELRTLAAVLRLLEEAQFNAPLLRDLQAMLHDNRQRASQAVKRLDQMVAAYESYQNQFFLPFAVLLLWPFWWGVAIERWRMHHREALSHTWLEALGELEALCSLAGYAYERPEDVWPQFEKGAPHLHATALGHPLLPPSHRVRNDVALGGVQRLLMVSGSNMSGKSTLLRAIGINAVLTQAGAPVCATAFSMTALQVGAVIRVEDSLQRGASRFYAEIERFKALLDTAQLQPPLLFLADEILHGTNTRDRVIGAQALIRALLAKGAIGLVTTHDLALTDFVQHLEAARNVHFQDDIQDGRLAFDYTLRDGVVTKSNALDLMRAVGLPVE